MAVLLGVAKAHLPERPPGARRLCQLDHTQGRYLRADPAAAHKRGKRWLVEGMGVEGTMQDKWGVVRGMRKESVPEVYARTKAGGGNFPFGDTA